MPSDALRTAALKIQLQAPRDEGKEWHRALATALPEATIAVWPDTLEAVSYTHLTLPTNREV